MNTTQTQRLFVVVKEYSNRIGLWKLRAQLLVRSLEEVRQVSAKAVACRRASERKQIRFLVGRCSRHADYAASSLVPCRVRDVRLQGGTPANQCAPPEYRRREQDRSSHAERPS